jgi:tubulin-specific chaperone A
MAKTISDEQMKLSIINNGNSAQKRTFDLEKSTRSLTSASDLLFERKPRKQLGKESTEYKTLLLKANNLRLLQ